MFEGSLRVCLALLLAAFLTEVVQGQEWTRFRGPNGQGISNARTIPTKWTEQDYNWKVKLPAGGHGSPVVWQDKVFVTCESPEPTGGILLALSVSDGRVLWREEYKLTPYDRFHRDNSYAASTPVVDADGVYVLWQTNAETIVAAVSHTGDEIWRRRLSGIHTQFGTGTSPMLYDDLLVFTHEQWENEKGYEGRWIALDRKTGETRWTKKRDNKQESYSTPCVYTGSGEPQLIFTSEAHGITGIDPKSGRTIWEMQQVLPARAISSPVIAGDLLIGTCGKGGAGIQLPAVRPGANGGSSGPSLAYKRTGKPAPYVPTPLVKDGLLFTFHDQGDVCCMRAATGDLLWCEKPAGKFYGSPVWVNGSLYCMDRAGAIVVIEAASTYKLLAINALPEGSQATPAVSDGRMYLRTFSHVISIGRQEK